MSQRPISVPPRPHSSASIRRPQSSAINRPPSSLSIRRPVSRLSVHPQSRQSRTRLLSLCKSLVSRTTGYQEDDERFNNAVEHVLKSLESTFKMKAAASVDMDTIDRQVRGHSQKARIHSQDILSEALNTCYGRIKAQTSKGSDLDDEIKLSHLPDHLQLILSLSQPATRQTLSIATSYLHHLRNPASPPPQLTWQDVLADEKVMNEQDPDCVDFELEPRVIKQPRGFGSVSDSSSPSLSPWTSDDDDDDDDTSSSHEGFRDGDKPAGQQLRPSYQQDTVAQYAHHDAYNTLCSKQYWREGWRPAESSTDRSFDLGDPSTLGPALRQCQSSKGVMSMFGLMEPERYIDEHNAVREVLIAMQGRRSMFFEEPAEDGTIQVSKSCPRLRHLSLSTQQSMLNSFAEMITTMLQLRTFAAGMFERCYTISANGAGASELKPNRTLEAFADAIHQEIIKFDNWCASREEWFITPPTNGERRVVSLLSTEMAVKENFSQTFIVLLDVVHKTRETKLSPAATATTLLDSLHASIQDQMEKAGIPSPPCFALMRVFVQTVEPIWQMIGRWLLNGMELGGMSELDEEFFIEHSAPPAIGGVAIGILDPSFWAEGFTLRTTHSIQGGDRAQVVIPIFLMHVAEAILAAGKAVGLLRVLNSGAFDSYGEDWPSFRLFLRSQLADNNSEKNDDGNGCEEDLTQNLAWIAASADSLSKLVYDALITRCTSTGAALATVLVDECQLWGHLSSIEGVYLSRQVDMADFTDVLLRKMDTSRSWADFHFLNSAFNGIVQANVSSGHNEWIQPSLVRYSYRAATKDKDKLIHQTVKAIDGLAVEYAIPFPLSYIFTPATLEIYGDIFVFLLQIRRSKYILDKILIRSPVAVKSTRHELKVLYALRSRFSWVVNTLLDFFVTYVMQSQVERFHEAFRRAESLDEMIQLHLEHIQKLKGRFLLNTNTSALHRGILSILDMSLHFGHIFTTCAGDNGLDMSRSNISLRPHRSRRRRAVQRNTVWFVTEESHVESSDSSDDGDVDLDRENEGGDALSGMESTMSTGGGDDVGGQIEKLGRELDGMVRFIRRGVESLAGRGEGSGAAFSVLRFSLEDWDV